MSTMSARDRHTENAHDVLALAYALKELLVFLEECRLLELYDLHRATVHCFRDIEQPLEAGREGVEPEERMNEGLREEVR